MEEADVQAAQSRAAEMQEARARALEQRAQRERESMQLADSEAADWRTHQLEETRRRGAERAAEALRRSAVDSRRTPASLTTVRAAGSDTSDGDLPRHPPNLLRQEATQRGRLPRRPAPGVASYR